MRYERSIDITAPPDAVWSVLRDVPAWPRWTESITAAEWVSGNGLVVGARARLTVRGAGKAVWTVTAVDEGRSFTWESRVGGVRSAASHVIEAAPGGSRVTLAVDLTGLLATLLRPLVARTTRANLEAEAEGLKKLAEAARVS